MIINGPADAAATILLAHGAGAPMDSQTMDNCSAALVEAGFRVARFEFSYMAARRQGLRRPPPRAETLGSEFLAAISVQDPAQPLIIGGKSMGGRVASMIADEAFDAGTIAGLLCLGYPFHPPAKPSELRTAHLERLRTPTLIVQGTRDPFGTREEVSQYRLSEQIEMLWLEDGDHDLTPRKRVSGFTAQDYLTRMADGAAQWRRRICAGERPRATP